MNHRRILRSAAVGIIIAAVVLAVTFIRRDRPPARVAIQVLKSETIDVGGEQRSYQLIVPQSRSGERIPLVIAFHGMGETAESMAEYARLDQLAAQQNVLVAIPEMSHGTWVIRDPGSMSAQNPDVQLFDALMNRLSEQYPIDPRRVYVLGMSNGASFAQLLMILRSTRIAAVVAHSGSPPKEVLGMTPERRCRILLLVGADDSQFVLADVTEAARAYRVSGHAVELIEVDGLGHAWSPDHDRVIWSFLASNRLVK